MFKVNDKDGFQLKKHILSTFESRDKTYLKIENP